MKRKRVAHPIVLKLILIISILVLLSSAIVTAIATIRFSEDSRSRVEKDLLEVNEILSYQINSVFSNLNNGIYLLFDSLRTVSGSSLHEQSLLNNFWARNAAVAAIVVPGQRSFLNRKFFIANELEEDIVKTVLQEFTKEQGLAQNGLTFVFNATPWFGFSVIGVVSPFKELGRNNALVVFLSTEEMQSITQSQRMYSNFLVNGEGDLLLHNDIQKLKSAVNEKEHPVVADLLTGSMDNKQILYTDTNGERYYGAYHRLALGSSYVVSVIPESAITAVVHRIFKQNMYLVGIVLVFAILFIFFFSRTFTRPIKRLENASHKIEAGDYQVDIKPTSRDEIGSLTQSFISMAKGLEERERIKTTFGKFVNKDIAEKALKGELTLGGVKKRATIFFSDIRSFTAISEKLLPEQVVEFLNQYMTRMVHCVNETSGVVDKYIGDAIMALWGAPVSAGTPADDAMNCIQAALKMRLSLKEFNKDRGSDDKPIIKIGCGINTGDAVAGQIGSEDRMEYTVIGDAVNLASRIEALNKPFGTDILISENTYELVKDKVIVEPMTPIKVKGKVAPLQIYAVVNLIDADYPSTLAQVREMVGIEAPTAAVNVEKEEVKYEILDSSNSSSNHREN